MHYVQVLVFIRWAFDRYTISSHTHTHTHTHAFTHTHTHTHTRAFTHACMHTHICLLSLFVIVTVTLKH